MPHTSLDEDTLEEIFEGKEGGEIAEWMINHVISGIDNATNGAYSDAVDELLIENGGFEDLNSRFSMEWGNCDIGSGEVRQICRFFHCMAFYALTSYSSQYISL